MKKVRICIVGGCGNRHEARGYCRQHYRRHKLYGSPNISKNGKPLAFIKQTLNMNTDECIEWKYCMYPYGYGQVSTSKGKHEAAHRVALKLKIGNPPDNKPLALHSCHNPKCINWKHLRWGDSSDNMKDMVLAGRSNRGTDVNTAKLNESTVIEIFNASGTCTELGKKFNISRAVINKIKNKKSWKHVTVDL